jgi:hypothetical protein
MSNFQDADPRRQWREKAGNPLMYDTMGACQFAFLTLFFGLRENHRVLEIGSGSLRAGRFLINYLNADNYCGVEPNTESVRLGVDKELGPEVAARKRPRFSHERDFGFGCFGHTFDYALSYSVFTHIPPPEVSIVFKNLRSVFHDGSIFLATAAFAEGEEQIVDQYKWTDLPINIYSFDRLESAAKASGLRLARLGKAFQDWFVAFRGDNSIALRGVEQMTKVRWDLVLPQWQDPGWKVPDRKTP